VPSRRLNFLAGRPKGCEHAVTAGSLPMIDHTCRAFDRELLDLRYKIEEIGEVAVTAVTDSVNALSNRDIALARSIFKAERRIDALRREIDEKAILTIARRQPMAADLRELIGSLQICSDYRQMGSLASEIAERVPYVDVDLLPKALLRGIGYLERLVLTQINKMLHLYTKREISNISSFCANDKYIDEVVASLLNASAESMIRDEVDNLPIYVHLIFCMKNAELIGNYATHVAATIFYMVDGHPLAPELGTRASVSSETVPWVNEDMIMQSSNLCESE
jgi:phosphate transport system protein